MPTSACPRRSSSAAGRSCTRSSPSAPRKASGLFDVQQHTFSHVPFKDIVYSPGPGLVGTITASPPEALLEELAFTSRLIRDHLGGECVGAAHAVRLLPRPARPARPARDRPRRRAPLRHLVGPQRGERQPDAVGAAVRLRRGGLPRHPRAAVPVLARRRLVRPARLRHRARRCSRRSKGAVDEIAERDLVYGACFHDWVAIASDERRVGWLRGFLRYAREQRRRGHDLHRLLAARHRA